MLKQNVKFALICINDNPLDIVHKIFENTEGVEIIGVFSDFQRAVEAIGNPNSDVILCSFSANATCNDPKNALPPSPSRRGVDRSAVTSNLSFKEKLLLEYLAQGLLYKEIALKTNASLGTLKQNVHKLYRKLNVSNRTEAVNLCFGRKA